MTARKQLAIGDLPREDALEILGRNHVGRIAFAFHDRVDIEPISFVFEDDWIYARTSPGAKLTTVLHAPYVAFEVDEVHDRYHWRSVVVHGTIYFPLPDGGPADQKDYQTAVELLRSAEPEALTDDDPTPHRIAVFRIHADEIIGREAALST